MHITMISAMGRNRIVGGADSGILWHVPRDTKFLRKFTDGKFLLRGHRTFEEMSGWFTNQPPMGLSRDPSFQAETGLKVHHVEEAISAAAEQGASELAVCGGPSVYAAALPYADELFLTLIDAEIAGAAFFPEYRDEIEWEELSRKEFPPDHENEYRMTFLRLRRLRPSSLRPARLHPL